MKRLLSLCLILCFVVSFSACKNQMNPAENALIAVKAMDIEAFSSYMTADSETALSRLVGTFKANVSVEEKETLKALYGLIRYTMGEESAVSDGKKTVSITVKIPDFARVKSLAEKKILVSAETANAVIAEMLASGEIANNYMLDITWQITIREEDGAWKIPYADKDNAAFAGGLYLSEMFTFFAQH